MSTEAEYKPGLEDVPAAKSAVSFLDGKKAVLEYRGIPVEELAKESSFEETSWLLIKGDLPTQKQLADFDHGLRQRRAIHYRLKDLIKCMPPEGHPMDALHASVAALVNANGREEGVDRVPALGLAGPLAAHEGEAPLTITGGEKCGVVVACEVGTVGNGIEPCLEASL